MPVSTRFYNYFWSMYQKEIREKGLDNVPDVYRKVALVMSQSETQRILIDRIQLANLSVGKEVPTEIQMELKWPFDTTMYVEPTGPVIIATENPREDEYGAMVLRAMLLVSSGDMGGGYAEKFLLYMSRLELSYVRLVVLLVSIDEVVNVIPFLHDLKSGQMWDEEGEAFTGSGVLGDTINRLAVYMTAKGIEIIEEPISRQQRRLLARKKLPNQWHIIRVSPTIRKNVTGSDLDRQGSKHNYRYDVMGHLRFGKHKLKDGSYKFTKEWVSPHQRGLENELYIPATRYYK